MENSNKNTSPIKLEFKATFSEIKELYRFINSVRSPKWMNLLFCAAFLLILLDGFLLQVWSVPALCAFLCLDLVFFLFTLFNEHLVAKLHIRNGREINGKKEITNIYELGDKIVLRSGVTEYTFEHSYVTGLCEKADCFILRVREKVHLFLPKRAFAEGDIERFRELFEGTPEISASPRRRTLMLILTVFVCALAVLLTTATLSLRIFGI